MQKMNDLLKWKGKIIGGLIGFLLRKPTFIIVGIVIGHLFDSGFFSNKSESRQQTKADAQSAKAYEVLGVAENASMEDIEQAYRKKISDYHPDKVANAAPELKALAEQRAREINAAYDELQKLHQKPKE
jgi:DnaJ-class molecular chaperone